ncbi:polysulfide reductase NrfD [Ectothiorhodospiraceae bacterium 2226]|nr:polysulfide reductase NrfD [Ectothiorhodospiraceae bacterium 2226]
MRDEDFREIEGRSPAYYALLLGLGALAAVGLAAALYVWNVGHYVTGMNNRVVWGTPHVFAIFLIVAASGALNVASVASVFGRTAYKPLSRLSALLAIALLVGGLVILVLDLGRPDRLIIAMTYYNFRSIFAWNIFLYTGFIAIAAVYLWMMMERRMNAYAKPVGLLAFVWRLVLTTGTGSIFGFLVARQAYDAAIMGPMFVIMSFAFGTAVFLLVLLAAARGTGIPLGDDLLRRLKNLLALFVAAVLYFVLIYHLTNLYGAQHHGIERFLLVDGGVYPALFWGVQILLGSVLPLALLFHPRLSRLRGVIAAAAGLVIVGGFAQLYVLIIGGQAYPMPLFPGREESSSYFDGVLASYAPSWPEIALGVGGVAFALLIVALAIKVLRFLPTTMADAHALPQQAQGAVDAATA